MAQGIGHCGNGSLHELVVTSISAMIMAKDVVLLFPWCLGALCQFLTLNYLGIKSEKHLLSSKLTVVRGKAILPMQMLPKCSSVLADFRLFFPIQLDSLFLCVWLFCLFAFLIFGCKLLVSSNIRLWRVLHCISYYVTWLYTKVDVGDFEKLSFFSVEKEKYKFVVTVFAMKV